MSQTNETQAVVIGAGIVGVCAALALRQAGLAVTLVDPDEPGGEHAASYGNGAFITPASIIPMSVPGLWRKVPGYLLDRDGPLTIRWRHLPRLTPWLLRFLAAGMTTARVERTAAILSGLLHDAPDRHAALAAAADVPGLIERRGVLYVYPDRAAFAAEALSWRLRRTAGVVWRELDAADLQAFEPALSPAYRFGIHVPAAANCADPGAYVAALAAHGERLGVRRVTAQATGFTFEGMKLRAVETDQGPIACNRVVVAAGMASARLAAAAGDRVPLEAERGYHVQLTGGAPGGPHLPVMPSDGKMANIVTREGLRAAGQVELAGPGAPPDWRRAEILLRHLYATWPGLSRDLPVRRWMGNRPSTPDGLPVISAARRSPDVFYAFGHGHVGLAAGPKSAALVAALVTGSTPPLSPAPFAATRFRW
ncbi:NAD(P)/FAD-dependent oxidoreductase [Tistrella mobilis]|uniref:FAD dependent oxidoreductase n=1 Tax=Tistrella mobilis (strain KA081020-065) TaxID=1110502 RepID=I3TTI0_TISMK|nr:FAD-dependent oxidoreductase [Tistrella mobilis]AFK56068.1 FAD dependent oxidoreductase [Tistrella mobilis KA081020-065]